MFRYILSIKTLAELKHSSFLISFVTDTPKFKYAVPGVKSEMVRVPDVTVAGVSQVPSSLITENKCN